MLMSRAWSYDSVRNFVDSSSARDMSVYRVFRGVDFDRSGLTYHSLTEHRKKTFRDTFHILVRGTLERYTGACGESMGDKL